MTTLTERQKKALELKGDHKIYYEDNTKDYQKFVETGEIEEDYLDDFENVRIVANLDEVDIIFMTETPEDGVGRARIPDHTPAWLNKILLLWNVGEFAESMFEFWSKEDADEFKAICDVVYE